MPVEHRQRNISSLVGMLAPMPRHLPIITALLLLPACLGGWAIAKDKDHDIAYEAMRRGEFLPLARILAISAEHVLGEIGKVDRERKQLACKLTVLVYDGR